MEERLTAAEIAGHGTEPTAWRILKEVSDALIKSGLTGIDPHHIVIEEDGHFSLERIDAGQVQEGFAPPEAGKSPLTEAGAVWSLGATVFYLVMGRQVMNGKGGRGQQANSKLPYLRSEWHALSELLQHCLRYEPSQRPKLQEIYDSAAQQGNRCEDELRRGPKFKVTEAQTSSDPGQDLDFWPEIMK